MNEPKRYVGIDKDLNGGMTDTGKIIRAAWVFGLIPETETCEGWIAEGLQDLWQKVDSEWEKYGFLVGNLPPEMRERFMRIHDEAVKKAEKEGWSADNELVGED